MTPALMNQQDAATYLGMCVNTFRKRVRHDLRFVWVGRKTMYPRADLDAWVEANARA